MKTYFVQDGIRFDPGTNEPVAGASGVGQVVEKKKVAEEKKEPKEKQDKEASAPETKAKKLGKSRRRIGR